MMDSSSQFEKQLSAQWHQIANKMGVPCNQSSNSQPIKGRLSQAIGFLVDEGKSQKEALHIVQTAVNTILGTDSEAEMNKLLELEVHHLLITRLSCDETVAELPVSSFEPAFGKGTPSTGLSTGHSSPTLVHVTGSPHNSPSLVAKKPIGKCSSLGHVVADSKKPQPNISLFDSKLSSLNTNHECSHCNTTNGVMCTSPVPSMSHSCPSTPHHSISNLSQKHESVKQTKSLGSSPTHSSVCVSPQLLGSKTHREHCPADGSQSATGNGICLVCKGVLSRASELSAVPETDDHNSRNGSSSELSGSAISSQTDLRVAALEERVDILTEEMGRLKTERRPHSPFKGMQSSPENVRGRVKSEGQKTMIKKMPRLGAINKAFSAGDTYGVTTEEELLGSYSPVSSLRTEKNIETEKDPIKQASTSNVDYVQEDLTKEELVNIAHNMNPTKGSLLSSRLHKDLHAWDDVVQRHPHATSEERILRILERWFENVPPGSENRQALAIVCENIDQKRLAHSIRNKMYT